MSDKPCSAPDLIARARAALSTDRDAASLQRHADNLGALVGAMLAHGRERHDPVRTLTACLGDRWTPLILNLLVGGSLRFGELRRLMCIISIEGDVSQRMLTVKLRLLERDGLVLRRQTAHVPPRVEYGMTPLGQGAYAQYLAVMHWAENATPVIRQAREAYDATHGPAPADTEPD